ncbi:unnamed protein product [Dovyalis caffra]|uniref:Uncharacterized protein n=1 Tax=Dovyalis caffra TaxID=77055 RepID=A0AAV1R217_9ROSI|nr:unnamed protein product [Dovyalis caffra]
MRAGTRFVREIVSLGFVREQGVEVRLSRREETGTSMSSFLWGLQRLRAALFPVLVNAPWTREGTLNSDIGGFRYIHTALIENVGHLHLTHLQRSAVQPPFPTFYNSRFSSSIKQIWHKIIPSSDQIETLGIKIYLDACQSINHLENHTKKWLQQ